MVLVFGHSPDKGIVSRWMGAGEVALDPAGVHGRDEFLRAERREDALMGAETDGGGGEGAGDGKTLAGWCGAIVVVAKGKRC